MSAHYSSFDCLMHYYKRDLDEWGEMTSHLSLTEDGALDRLVNLSAKTEQPLTADFELLCRRLRAFTGPEKKAVRSVLKEFFEATDAGYVSPWVTSLIDKANGKKKTLQQNGSLGGKSKANAKQTDSKDLANATNGEVNAKPLQDFRTSGLQNSKTVPPHSVAAALPGAPAAALILREESWPGLEEVQQEADRVMVPPACALKFWNDHEQVGWRNKHGVPIANWRPGFANYATAWKSNEFRDSAGFGPQKKWGGGGPEAPTGVPALVDLEPEGWRDACAVIYEFDALAMWPAWEHVPPANRMEIRTSLRKKKKGGGDV